MLRSLSRSQQKRVWISSLHLLAFLECLFGLVVRFHVPNAMQAGVWVSRLDLLLTSWCYRMFGSASPPSLRFHVSKTQFSFEGITLSAFFFWLGFKSQRLCRILRCCFESFIWKARCSRLYEQFVKVQYFTKSILLGEVESLHLLHDQQKSTWLLPKVDSLLRKIGCSRLYKQFVRSLCFTNPRRVVGFERLHVWPEEKARKCVFASYSSSLL
jgi:hypothetical protein